MGVVSTAARLRLAALIVAAVALAGCAGRFAYPNALAKNVRIHTRTDSGSMFSSVRAALDIYRVDAQCKIEYLGSVDLDEPATALGLPPQSTTYLVFEFASASFLANSRSRISYETLFEPVAGSRYDIEVSYLDDIYNVEIRESARGGAVSRVDRRDLRDCAGA